MNKYKKLFEPIMIGKCEMMLRQIQKLKHIKMEF